MADSEDEALQGIQRVVHDVLDDMAKSGETPPAGSTEPVAPVYISYDDFAKVQLKVGHVLEAERVPKTDKLIRLKVDLGEPEPRTIVAGIGLRYLPQHLIGRQIVVVANLAPRKLRGIESHGMLLAGSSEDEMSLVSVMGSLPPGSAIG